MSSDSLHPAVECRFEYSVTNLESSLTIEKQQHEASAVELAEAQGKIEELLSEVGNTDEKSTLLQSTVQRFFFNSPLLQVTSESFVSTIMVHILLTYSSNISFFSWI